QHRIFKFLAWEETKRKAPYGYADYPKLAAAKLDAMITAEIGKFLMICALASDLYCPTYVSGATLAKDSKLVKEAAHYKINYKINATKVIGEVRRRRPAKSSKPKPESKGRAARKQKQKGR